ncbi:MAG TPA: substrate-binding domain-containing protein [Stellaceae bacterium]|nr:substrate-binding domain-containing protein [Stellaceae bacterium]
MRPLAALPALALLVLGARLAAADQLNVLSAGAVQGAMKTLAADYQAKTGTTVQFTFGNVGQIADRLKAGDPADVVILSASAIDDLAKGGNIGVASARPLGKVGMGVAVAEGATPPDIATPDAFKAALLAAPSIAYSDPQGGGSSGIFFDRLIQKLGIADQIRAKAVLIRGGSAADQIAQGKAAMAVQNASELIDVPGIRYVGPFPAADQNYITYSAGVYAQSGQAKAAADFIDFVTRRAAAPRWRAAGVEPASGR